MQKLLSRLTGTAFRRGLGGSRPWLAIGMVTVGLRALRRLANPKPQVLYRAVLRPGEAYEIRTRRTD